MITTTARDIDQARHAHGNLAARPLRLAAQICCRLKKAEMAPAHSSFEQALAGVTAFATAVESESEEERPRYISTLFHIDQHTTPNQWQEPDSSLLLAQVKEGQEREIKEGENKQEELKAQGRHQEEAQEEEVSRLAKSASRFRHMHASGRLDKQ